MYHKTFYPNRSRLLGCTHVLFPSARRAVRAPMLLAVALATVMVLLAGCDSTVAPESVPAPAGDAAAAKMSKRGSWNNWHVHDLPPGAEVYTEENGLTHRPFAIFPQIFDDYATTPSLHAYCPDGVDKGLLGGGGGSKIASGTCQNEDTLIHLKNQANDAPGPEGWIQLPPGPSFTVYYRLTPR